MLYRIFYRVVAILTSILGMVMIAGGLFLWPDYSLAIPAFGLGLVAGVLSGWFWHMGNVGEPPTPYGRYARVMGAVLTIRNLGYLVMLGLVLFATSPQGEKILEQFFSHL